MDYVKRGNLETINAPGRMIQRVFGEEAAYIHAANANMGFAHFSLEYGRMSCHKHEDEIIYVLAAKDVYVRFGPSEAEMVHKQELSTGDTIRCRDQEWHIFEFTSKEGYLDIIFFYSQGATHVVNGQ